MRVVALCLALLAQSAALTVGITGAGGKTGSLCYQQLAADSRVDAAIPFVRDASSKKTLKVHSNTPPPAQFARAHAPRLRPPQVLPDAPLVEAIAVAKVRAVETVIRLCFRLKQAIGSYALMKGSGFEELDSMQIAKFAEGESFVLMQKLARDRVKGSGGAVDAVGDDEAAIVEELKGARTAEWLAKAEKVYALAELVMDRAMRAEVGAEIPKGVARPWAAKL